jgi:hypothetical protein
MPPPTWTNERGSAGHHWNHMASRGSRWENLNNGLIVSGFNGSITSTTIGFVGENDGQARSSLVVPESKRNSANALECHSAFNKLAGKLWNIAEYSYSLKHLIVGVQIQGLK